MSFENRIRNKLRQLSVSFHEKKFEGIFVDELNPYDALQPDDFENVVGAKVRMHWDVVWSNEGDATCLYQDYVLQDIRPEGRLFRGLPQPDDFHSNDYHVYKSYPFVFVPDGLPLSWMALDKHHGAFDAPSKDIRQLYSEADLLLWMSISGFSIPDFNEYMDRENYVLF